MVLSRISRKDLKASLRGSVSNDNQLKLLKKKDYNELVNVLSDSFLDDPLFNWTAGLDNNNSDDAENVIDNSSSKKRRGSILKLNQSLMGWLNRPILFRKKGIVLGIKAPPAAATRTDSNKNSSSSSSGALAGAVVITPGHKSIDGVMDTLTNLMKVGIPPLYTKEKVNYGPHADKRLESMTVLSKKKQALMKKYNSGYIYIQTIGVMGQHQGKGLGGKLLREIIQVADSIDAPLYLETESKENESLYQHFGFHTAETLELEAKGSDKKQKMWLMIRNPPEKKENTVQLTEH